MNAEEMRKEADSIRPSDPARAAELYAEASDMGDAQASSSLGYMLMVGEGVGKDLKGGSDRGSEMLRDRG